MLERRAFLQILSRVAGASLLGGCLDPRVPSGNGDPQPDPTPFAVNEDLQGVCDPGSSVTIGDLVVSTHPWPRGLDCAALIDVDDLCPVFLPDDGLDFGGDLSSNGTLNGFLVDQLAASYPEAKVCLMTIADMRQNPLTQTPIAEDDRYLLSRQPDWAAAVRQLLDAHPNFHLAMHGYWHFSYPERSATEFHQYTDLTARDVMRRMHREFVTVFPMVEPVFRAPGWATTPGVLRYVADAGLLLADSSSASTFAGSTPTCESVGSNLSIVRAGPDFSEWITQTAQNAGLMVGHFHFTAPNSDSLGADGPRRTALGFAKAIRTVQGYRIDWFSYHEAARAVARARAVTFSVTLVGNTVVIVLGPGVDSIDGVTLALWNLGGRDVAVRTSLGDQVTFQRTPSARGCDYIVLSA